MRTALLSTLELTEEGKPRAFERFGGRSLLEWQVDIARDLGCSRIVCLAQGERAAIREVREQCERAGLDFLLIGGPLPLVGLLSADQELVVIADGLVADRDRVKQALGDGRGVLTLPDEAGIAAGFERIDARHAWGGVLVARAQIAEQLADMPPDSDTISLLLRLALQAGTRLVPLEEDVLQSGEWLLLQEPDALATRETALLDRSVEHASWTAPGMALSRRLARAIAPEGLDRGPAIALGIAGVSFTGAVALASFEFPFAGIAMFGGGSLALSCREALDRLKARLRGMGSSGRNAWLGMLPDAVLIAALALPLVAENALSRLFLPLVLVGLLWLAEGLAPIKWKNFWSDRVMLALLLLPAAWFGMLEQTLAGLCLLTLASCLFFQRKSKITQA